MFKHKDATKYGIDIAKGRVDTLDKEVIDFAIKYKGKKVAIDLGSGQSRLSVILALLGFEVWCYDIKDHSKYFATLSKVLEVGDKLHFKKIDISKLTYEDLPTDIIVVISQRVLHHLKYTDTKNLLKKINKKMSNSNVKLYISLSGLNSKLSQGYKCLDSPIENRFCKVGEVGKDIYSISSNVCLYNKKEAERLIREVGFNIDSIKESDFGNIRIVASK